MLCNATLYPGTCRFLTKPGISDNMGSFLYMTMQQPTSYRQEVQLYIRYIARGANGMLLGNSMHLFFHVLPGEADEHWRPFWRQSQWLNQLLHSCNISVHCGFWRRHHFKKLPDHLPNLHNATYHLLSLAFAPLALLNLHV